MVHVERGNVFLVRGSEYVALLLWCEPVLAGWGLCSLALPALRGILAVSAGVLVSPEALIDIFHEAFANQ